MNELMVPIKKINITEDNVPCIYTLYSEGKAIYVGQTISLKSRLLTHRGSKNFDHFSFFNCQIDDLDNEEAIQIVKRKPTDNIRLPKNNQFVSGKKFIRELSEIITLKIEEESSFIGKSKKEGVKGIAYINREFTEGLKELIENYTSKGE